MLGNYLKTILRNAGRNPVYTSITIAGLAIGLAACLIIGLFVQYELSYDRFHEDAEIIYRVVQEETDGDVLAWSGPQMGLKLRQDFPQIESVIRLIDGSSGYGMRALISYENEVTGRVLRFNEEGFIYADPEFFHFFSFTLTRGTPETVLNRPRTVVITESTARKYFGDTDPIGKTLLLSNRFPLEVTGIAADPPKNSHLGFNFIASYQTFYVNQNIPGEVSSFWWPPTHTYIKLHPHVSSAELNAQLPAFSRRHRDTDGASILVPVLQPLTEIWLGKSIRGQQQAGGSIAYVYLFSAIAVIILGLACVNFMNLTTARAAKRSKEIGVRKAVGAARAQLTVQFLVEALLLSATSFALALLIAELLLPFFNNIAERNIAIPYGTIEFWFISAGLVAATGLAAGSYPALFLSGFRPILTIKNSDVRWSQGTGLRKSLVVFQFMVSMVLLLGVFVVYQQLSYANQVNMGFNRDRIVILQGEGFAGETGDSRYEAFKSELMNKPGIVQITSTSNLPGISGSVYIWEAEGFPPEPNRQFPIHFVGENFFEMLEVEPAAGRMLRAGDPADIGAIRLRIDQTIQTPINEHRAIVINESAARQFGWTAEDAIGKQMRFYITEYDNVYQDYRGSIVGVIRDYHTGSLHEPIGPLAYLSNQSSPGNYLWIGHILVKIAPGNLQSAMQTIEDVWKTVVTDLPFESTYLDQSLANLYRSEIRFGRLIAAFTILAVLIACLGLLGLVTFTAESRTKEIGIRKVLGASVMDVIILLSKDFTKLVAAAIIIAVPVGYYFMNRWLEDFAYRIDLTWWIFAFTGICILVIALATVCMKAISAATANPVESLRYE